MKPGSGEQLCSQHMHWDGMQLQLGVWARGGRQGWGCRHNGLLVEGWLMIPCR